MLATENDKVYVINANDTDTIKHLNFKEAYVITYGLCNKATITLSSITEEHIVLCLQRAIITLDGQTIEPQEISFSLSKEYDPETIMLITAICLISGISANKLSNFMF
ncbi:MAG: hypothetical protein GX800_07025 [Clostridiaceae bacterium]|nr:hypothetical protein [Clostridiaceae bacterium]